MHLTQDEIKEGWIPFDYAKDTIPTIKCKVKKSDGWTSKTYSNQWGFTHIFAYLPEDITKKEFSIGKWYKKGNKKEILCVGLDEGFPIFKKKKEGWAEERYVFIPHDPMAYVEYTPPVITYKYGDVGAKIADGSPTWWYDERYSFSNLKATFIDGVLDSVEVLK